MRSAIVTSLSGNPTSRCSVVAAPMLNSCPNRCGYLPVNRPARVGLQNGPVTYASVNRIPERASESMFGVGMSLLPWKPTSAYPMSSATMITTLAGRDCAQRQTGSITTHTAANTRTRVFMAHLRNARRSRYGDRAPSQRDAARISNPCRTSNRIGPGTSGVNSKSYISPIPSQTRPFRALPPGRQSQPVADDSRNAHHLENHRRRPA